MKTNYYEMTFHSSPVAIASADDEISRVVLRRAIEGLIDAENAREMKSYFIRGFLNEPDNGEEFPIEIQLIPENIQSMNQSELMMIPIVRGFARAKFTGEILGIILDIRLDGETWEDADASMKSIASRILERS